MTKQYVIYSIDTLKGKPDNGDGWAYRPDLDTYFVIK